MTTEYLSSLSSWSGGSKPNTGWPIASPSGDSTGGRTPWQERKETVMWPTGAERRAGGPAGSFGNSPLGELKGCPVRSSWGCPPGTSRQASLLKAPPTSQQPHSGTSTQHVPLGDTQQPDHSSFQISKFTAHLAPTGWTCPSPLFASSAQKRGFSFNSYGSWLYLRSSRAGSSVLWPVCCSLASLLSTTRCSKTFSSFKTGTN